VDRKQSVARRIITLIARHDKNWSQVLFDSFYADANKRSRAKIASAMDIAETDPATAGDLAADAIKGSPPPGLVGVIKKLHKSSPGQANELFLLFVRTYPSYLRFDMGQYAELGTYLFTAPQLDPDDYDSVMMTAIPAAGVVMPNLTKTRTGTDPALIQAYIRTAIALMLKPTPDTQQAKLKFAIGYMLAPKARDISPNLEAELTSVMGTLQRMVPSELASDAAFKYLDPATPLPTEDRLKEIDKNPDSSIRDLLYLDMAANAWWRSDFDFARMVADKLSDTKVKDELLLVITFGEVNKLLKAKPVDLDELDKKVNTMPEVTEKAMLYLGLAEAARNVGKMELEKDFISNAERTCQRIDESSTPFLLFAIAARSREIKVPGAQSIYSDAVKRLNRIDKPVDPILQHSIGTFPTQQRFPISVKNVDVGFPSSFARLIVGEGDYALTMATELDDERLKAAAFIAVAKLVLDSKPEPTRSAKSLPSAQRNRGQTCDSAILFEKSSARLSMQWRL
ncbi:MAG: hypothetical protein ABJA02_16525, partial [Acidobacteriota bacterium]